jgi:hypothetical protein
MSTKEFVNAQQMAKDYPDTFEAPPYEDFADLVPGDYVKICSDDERFWCEIVDIDHTTGTITGSVANNLINHDWPVGKMLYIKFDNIYSILKK